MVCRLGRHSLLRKSVGICDTYDMETKQIIDAAGGVVRVARKIGRSHSTISEWKRVPPKHVQAVSVLSGIPAWKIRPDVFPAPISAGAVDVPENGTGEAA